MSARRTKAELLAMVADRIEFDYPEEAAILRGFKKSGRKTIRDADGFTALDHAHFAIWREIKHRTDAGEDDSKVTREIAKREGVDWDRIDRLWRLDGEPHVRRLRANVSSHDGDEKSD